MGSPLPSAWRVGIRPSRFAKLINKLKIRGELKYIGSAERPVLVHRNRLDLLGESVLKTVKEQLAQHQPRRALPRNTLTRPAARLLIQLCLTLCLHT